MDTRPLISADNNADVVLESSRHLQRHWFVVFTKTHHEKRVAQYLAEREVEHFLPLYQTVRHWTNRRKVTLDLPLFPGYIFVRIGRLERVRTLEVPGVFSIVSSGREPAPLPDFEIDSLRSELHLRSFEPYPHLATGGRVRIRSGALAGMEGVVVRRKNSTHVVLTLDLIMKSVLVNVDAHELEAAGPSVFHC